MIIKNSLLTLAVVTALAGASTLAAPTAVRAAEMASTTTTTTTTSEDAKDASEKAAADRNDAIDDKYVPASGISAQVIYDQLTAAGYKDIDDIEFKNNVWEAEAKDPGGKDVELTLDPNDGHIINTKKD